MTCVAGLVDGGKIYFGADSAGVADYDMLIRADEKVFINGPMLFGFCGSFRMGQLLRYALKIPDHPNGVDDARYLSTLFIDAVRCCFKEGGWARKSEDAESGGHFLVGYKGHIYHIEADYQVGRRVDGFDAIGCGRQIALGSLFSTANTGMKPDRRLALAMNAAERMSAGVRSPFVWLSL